MRRVYVLFLKDFILLYYVNQFFLKKKIKKGKEVIGKNISYSS